MGSRLSQICDGTSWGVHSGDVTSVSPGPAGATPSEGSGQIHRCRTTSRTAPGVPGALRAAGGDGPGPLVDVQPHSRKDPKALAKGKRHACLRSSRGSCSVPGSDTPRRPTDGFRPTSGPREGEKVRHGTCDTRACL